MADNLTELQTILTDVDGMLRERLKEIGGGVAHVLMAIGPEGTSLVRANVEPSTLKQMGAELIEMAEEAMMLPMDGEPIH